MDVLINIDVPDLDRAQDFYQRAFGLSVGRRFGRQVVELRGFAVPVYLLENAAGSSGAAAARRTYDRHWTPVHLDIAVDDIGTAIARAVAAGAVLERAVEAHVWGRIAVLGDPFGHGFCLIQFHNRGYDEIADGA